MTNTKPHITSVRRSIIGLSIVGLVMFSPIEKAAAETSLTISDVRERAVQHNRTYLAAMEEVEIAKSEITRAWADALPDINVDASYNRNFTVPSTFFEADGETAEFKFGFKNTFSAGITARQSIWHGGRVLTALKIARLYEDYSEAIVKQAEAEVLFGAESLFYSALLARSQFQVVRKALESNSANLEVVEEKFSQGVVSEFELLRTRVEKQNLLPEILMAESHMRLSVKRLKSYLGIDLDEKITLVESQSDTSITGFKSLVEMTEIALERRPEVIQARSLDNIAKKAVTVARADYWPSFDAFGNYSWQSVSDDFTLSENKSSSWTAGLTVSMPIFTGGRTSGMVSQRRAQHRQASLRLQQVQDDIKLEVEQAYDHLFETKQALDVQVSTIAAAEEGLRIAQLRYESGVGTQLEVLSAQTALTQARTIKAQTLHGFFMAIAGLKRAATQEAFTE